MNFKPSEQLNSFTFGNVFLTFAKLYRDDQFGEWSFTEIGYRFIKGHPQFIENETSGSHNFNLIQIPEQCFSKEYWEIATRLLKKGRSASEIQSVFNFLERGQWILNTKRRTRQTELG